jgi:hypothetical protein
MLLEEGLALAVAEAEKNDIHVGEWHLRREPHIGIAVQALMHVGQKVSGIALTVYKLDLCLGMVDEQSDEFACRITGSTKYSYFYHKLFVYSSGMINQRMG